VAALALVPLGFVVVYTVITGPQEAWDLLVRPRVGMLVWNTVRLVVCTIGLSLVIGVGCAWLVERSNLPLRPLWHGLLVAPLAVPAFVNSYGWVSLTHAVQGGPGAVMIVTLSYYPLVYLPVVATLRGLDPALEEAAYSLNHSPWRTFRRVVLPQLRPAMYGGALLVGLHLLSEFGAIQMLRFPTFTTAIYDQFRSSFNSAAANMIAGILVLFCVLMLSLELRLRGRRRYASVSQGAARPVERHRLGPWMIPALLAVGLVVAAAVGVPTWSLVHWLRVGTSAAYPVGDLTGAALTSLGLGAVAAVLVVVLALPVAWLAVRYRTTTSTMVERSTYIGNALPGIVVALALVTVSIRVVQPLYQTFALLVAAYAIMFLPRAVVTVRAALEQAPLVLDDVAHSLGAGPIATARRVTLPLIAPGIGAGAALVFLAVATELTATLMLAPIDVTTLATKFWSAQSSVEYGAAAPYALLMVLISIPATVWLGREARATIGAT
jgi:iron(III) transport system permease protein